MENYCSFETVCQLQDMISSMPDISLSDIIEFIEKEHFLTNDDSISDLLDSLALLFNANRLASDDLTLILVQFQDQIKSYFDKRSILNLYPFETFKYFILHFSDLKLVQLEPNKMIEAHQYFSPEMGFIFHRKTTDDFSNEEEFYKFRREGKNQRQICNIIRNDDITSLQNLLSTTTINLNDTITPSLFERFEIINQKDATFIEYAAFFGSIKIFKFLIMNKVIIPSNLAKFAIAGGNYEIIHLCEEKNLSFDDCLSIAIQYKQDEIVEYLLNNYELTSDLYEIAFKSFNCGIIHRIIFDLFEFNDGSEKDELITKIIKNSIISGHISIVMFEIENGFIEYISKELFLIVDYHRYSMLELVFNYLEDIEFVNEIDKNYGMRLIDYSIKKDLRCFSYLCGIEGIDLNGLPETGQEPPIIRIARLNKTNIFESFLSRISIGLEEDYIDDYFEINAINNEGETALHIACSRGNFQIVKMLASFGSINIDCQTNEGQTPLHYAAIKGSIEIVLFLVSKCQANKNLHDNKGVLKFFCVFLILHLIMLHNMVSWILFIFWLVIINRYLKEIRKKEVIKTNQKEILYFVD